MLRVVALLSGRVFVGPELNRNEEFLNCTIGYTIDSYVTSIKLRPYSFVSRFLVRLFMAEYWAVQRQLATMIKLLRPLVERRMQREPSPNVVNMTDWNMKNSPKQEQANVTYQAHQQLQVSFAAIHTTAKLVADVCFYLARHSECIQPLRDEIDTIIGPQGVLTRKNVADLKKMDSFMTETQRHNPPGIMTFNRRIESSITLSDGTHLSAGTYLAAASSRIAMDAEFWEAPQEFDGFRFERMRERAGSEHKYQVSQLGRPLRALRV